MKENKIIIYAERGISYDLTAEDMDRVNAYCENECLGIQFLISAKTLRELIDIAASVGYEPPYTVSDLLSPAVKAAAVSQCLSARVESRFGTEDYSLIVPIIIKQTYNFLFKR